MQKHQQKNKRTVSIKIRKNTPAVHKASRVSEISAAYAIEKDLTVVNL